MKCFTARFFTQAHKHSVLSFYLDFDFDFDYFLLYKLHTHTHTHTHTLLACILSPTFLSSKHMQENYSIR